MAYKIANIKWLRDQGWSISSSYASGFCPTYNEIVNEIPKGSTTVNVNGTCIATSKAYANNQLVCESDISIGSDCPQYQITPDKQVTCDGGIVHFTATQEPQTKYIGTYVAKGSASPIGSVAENITFTAGGSTYTIEEANLNFDSTSEAIPYPIDMLGKSITSVKVETEEGETFNARISPSTITDSTYLVTIQLVPPQPSVSVTTNLIISDGSSGSLLVTGSTYTAQFIIAGPNAGTGELSGTLTADIRDDMTFGGRWDGNPGGTILNSCTSYAPQSLYAVGDAHWDLAAKRLYVTLSQCKP